MQSGWVYLTEADIGALRLSCTLHAPVPPRRTSGRRDQGSPRRVGIAQIDDLPPAQQLDGALITVQIGGNDLWLESACISAVKRR